MWTHMQQTLKKAIGGQPFMEQRQGVVLLEKDQNNGFTIGAKIQIQIQIRSNWGSP